MSKSSLYLANETATVAFGRGLGSSAKEGGVIYLDGDLGAGKTTLTRGILLALGHHGAVKSPTYTLVEPYLLGGKQVFHFDLYRLGDAEELEYMGIRDYFQMGNLCIIEWPARGEGVLPPADLIVKVSVTAPGRSVELKAQGNVGEKILFNCCSLTELS